MPERGVATLSRYGKAMKLTGWARMQAAIDADKSDLFDVLAYVAFASDPISREARAEAARAAAADEFTDKQNVRGVFVGFQRHLYSGPGR